MGLNMEMRASPMKLTVLYPDWGYKVLINQNRDRQLPRYEEYAKVICIEIMSAAMKTFIAYSKHHGLDIRTSEYSPPRYLASFRFEYVKSKFMGKIMNVDPGWALVEYGSHPGGDPEAFVPAYKPLTRGLLVVHRRYYA